MGAKEMTQRHFQSPWKTGPKKTRLAEEAIGIV